MRYAVPPYACWLILPYATAPEMRRHRVALAAATAIISASTTRLIKPPRIGGNECGFGRKPVGNWCPLVVGMIGRDIYVFAYHPLRRSVPIRPVTFGWVGVRVVSAGDLYVSCICRAGQRTTTFVREAMVPTAAVLAPTVLSRNPRDLLHARRFVHGVWCVTTALADHSIVWSGSVLSMRAGSEANGYNAGNKNFAHG